MANRRQLRESAVQILYGLDFYDMDPGKSISAHSFHFGKDASDDGFLQEIITGVSTHKSDIDDLIRQFSTNWRLERMAIVDRNILRMATYELLHLVDIPRKVSINEAIEVAKKYGGDDSPSFINGILDRIALEVRGPETDEERAKGEQSTEQVAKGQTAEAAEEE